MTHQTCILAQAAPAPAPAAPAQPLPPQPGLLDMLMPLIIMFVLFYFLLIRPQQKKQKEHEKLIASVKTGDKVVTSAGLHGFVANVKDKTFILKTADGVKLEFDKSAIAAVTKQAEE